MFRRKGFSFGYGIFPYDTGLVRYLQEHCHVCRKIQDIPVFVQVFRIDQIFVLYLCRKFFAKGIQRSVCLIAGGFYLYRAYFVRIGNQEIHTNLKMFSRKIRTNLKMFLPQIYRNLRMFDQQFFCDCFFPSAVIGQDTVFAFSCCR